MNFQVKMQILAQFQNLYSLHLHGDENCSTLHLELKTSTQWNRKNQPPKSWNHSLWCLIPSLYECHHSLFYTFKASIALLLLHPPLLLSWSWTLYVAENDLAFLPPVSHFLLWDYRYIPPCLTESKNFFYFIRSYRLTSFHKIPID